ncbi:MAG: hypothetical protein R6U50_10760 [Desulfobacterales bacterium]
MSEIQKVGGVCHIGDSPADAMQKEESVREKVDEHGNIWSKVYFGSGAHFKNWLSQVLEIFGEENVEVEPVELAGLKCFEEPGNRAHRIWVKKKRSIV